MERCFQIVETADRSQLDEWIAKWEDLVVQCCRPKKLPLELHRVHPAACINRGYSYPSSIIHYLLHYYLLRCESLRSPPAQPPARP